MIKIQNNTATREPIPVFLSGLNATSLLDLSWTDPQLGVQDCAWWPEEDQSAPLGEYQRYGEETLTIDPARHVVVVTREVLDWSVEEIAADRKSKVPQSVTMRQARLALFSAELLDDVEMVIAAAGRAAQLEWEYAAVVDRSNPAVAIVQQQQGLTDAQIDDLFREAAKL